MLLDLNVINEFDSKRSIYVKTCRLTYINYLNISLIDLSLYDSAYGTVTLKLVV